MTAPTARSPRNRRSQQGRARPVYCPCERPQGPPSLDHDPTAAPGCNRMTAPTARSPRNRRSQQGRPPHMRRPSSRRCRERRVAPLAWPAGGAATRGEPLPTTVPDPDKPARPLSKQARRQEQSGLQQDDGACSRTTAANPTSNRSESVASPDRSLPQLETASIEASGKARAMSKLARFNAAFFDIARTPRSRLNWYLSPSETHLRTRPIGDGLN